MQKKIYLILAILILASFYFSIFWFEWILVFGLCILLFKDLIKRLKSKNHNSNLIIFLIEIALIIYLLFPLHLILAIGSFTTTIELMPNNTSSCDIKRMQCSKQYEECNYNNTRNCICRACFTSLNYYDCNVCFMHDKNLAYCKDSECGLGW